MNYSLLALLALVAASSVEASHPREHYEQLFFEHMTKFQLDFKDGKEFLQRLEIFAKNFDFIESHNSNTKNTYKLGLNQFAHLTFDEFLDTVHINGASPPNLRRAPADFLHTAPSNLSELPAEVDHVAAGAVTAVKNQGSCGSCWAFSTVGAIESAYKLKHGDLKTFSEQEIVSCDIGGDDLGCNGGWMDSAFEWVKSNGGITTSDAYPYTSGTGGKTGTCKTTGYENDPKTAPQSYTDVQTGSVTALQSAVAQQPVSIAIQANQLAFQFYQSGVLTGKCGQRLDHGVLLVGYGTDSSSGLDFWKIKNSWGSTWGEGGYIRILRSSDDLCGVLDAPSYPNL